MSRAQWSELVRLAYADPAAVLGLLAELATPRRVRVS